MNDSNSEEKISRDIKKISIDELSILQNPAPINAYSFYELPNDWNLINTHFMDKINLKLNECKARKEIVEPIKDQIFDNPSQTSFFQEPIIIAFGIPVIFSFGVITGIILMK
jgi:hypothetical protein